MREKTNNLVPTRSDTNQVVQSQKMFEAGNFGFRKLRNCTIRVAKTKALTAKLICSFVFAQAFCWLSYAVSHIADSGQDCAKVLQTASDTFAHLLGNN